MTIRLPWAKSDQAGEGATVSILARPGSPYCPVAAFDAWVAAGRRGRGPLFVSLQRSKHVSEVGVQRLAPKAVERVIKQAAKRAGLKGDFAGHSLRRGLVTTAVDAGVPLEQVMRHARHASIQTTLGYAEARVAEAVHPRVGLDVSSGATDDSIDEPDGVVDAEERPVVSIEHAP